MSPSFPTALPPGLSLLWESADEQAALKERFGFADLAEAERWLSAMLDEHWGLTLRSCRRLTISDHNAIAWVSTDGADLVVKWSREERLFPRLEATTGLITHLAGQGIPVAAPSPARDGAVRVVTDGPIGPLSIAVLPEIAGTWLDVTDLDAVRTVGACLARMHEVLGGLALPVLEGPPPRAPRERVRIWLEEHDHGRAPSASARLAALVQDVPDLVDTRQLVHGDVRAANLLMQGDRVAAVLDLDEVRVDHRIAELAQTSVLLGTLFRDWRPTPAPARQALREGYEQVRPLGEAERAWLEALTLWIGLASIPAEDAAPWIAAVASSSAG
ncbi:MULTISPECIES: phosphotransferase enzyme family protein [Brachybacterium]|uniref:phosphotransferase enzyme family protein n=1 Tax=Brachybacterium TaxID=43668 RepID=UPI0006B5FFF3|nr:MULTISPECIES: phosphotransferase [Brachybacterium]GAP79360.1 aminoglycoside phosphotransferase [Brachybacterium sp. SW0106-09]